MTVLLFTASRDWETVKYVITGNSSSKQDQLGSEGKVAEQSLKCLIILIFYLFILSLIYSEATRCINLKQYLFKS